MAENSLSVLDTIYVQALDGVIGSESVTELAQDYMKGSGTPNEKIDSLIRWQVAKCASTGFVTGLGGVLALPVAIPADVGVTLYVQLRMAAAIAYMRGYDIRSDQVKSFVYVCLCGGAAAEVLRGVGIKIGTKIAENYIKKKISGEVLKKINNAVIAKIFTKGGTKGVINLGKAVPVVGGIIGAIFDGVTTDAVGEAAKMVFSNTR